MHDFRLVGDGEYKNLIFDLVVDHTKGFKPEDEYALKKGIDKELKALHPRYNAMITIDREFTVM